MNIIRVIGGLGNQLFQYAFGKAQLKYGSLVAYDTSWYQIAQKPTELRPLHLYKFMIPSIKLVNGFDSRFETIVEDPKRYNTELLKLRNKNFKGYWQYEEYFSDLKDELQKELQINPMYFTRKNKALLEQVKSSESVAVHIRRGDYLKHGFPIVPLSYYYEAISNIPGDLFIFSDDMKWCQENFKPDYFKRNIYFIDEVDFISFEIMKACSHQIMSNSTFSWWAAYLNNNPDKIVIAPNGWIDSSSKNTHYLDSWVIL